MLGETVSHYKVLKKLGQGGMGEVYLAEDTRLGRKVALKFLAPELSRHREALVRFRNEARAAAELSHPNIATIHDFDEADGKRFLVLEYLAGQTLRERCAQGPLPIEDVIRIGKSLAAGLSEAHSHGIVHRDIKSDNVILTSKGEVKILDFGLARRADATQITREGTTLGTVGYMSPEQARGKAADERSDIWSLGVVLYECLTGRLPFVGEAGSILEQIKTSEATPPTALRTGIPMELEQAVLRCLEKDAQLRYQHADDLLAKLKSVEAHTDAPSRTSTTSSDTAEVGTAASLVQPREARGLSGPRHRPLWVLAIVVVATLAVYFVQNRGSTNQSPDPKMEFALAVVDFRDLDNPDDLHASASMTELVNIGLIENSPVRVVSPEYLLDLRRRLFGVSRGPIEDGQIIEVAQEAGATLLLAGRMGRTSDVQFVTWRLVDTRSGQSVGAQKVEGGKLTTLVDRVVEGVLPIVADVCGIEEFPSPRLVERITTESPEAYERYIAGVLSVERGDHDNAAREWKAAVTIDSTFALAHLELGRLYWGAIAELRDARKSQNHLDKAHALRTRLGAKDLLRLQAARSDARREVQSSIASYEMLLARWPDDRQALEELMTLQMRYWNSRAACTMAERLIEMYPDERSASAHDTYVKMLNNIGRPEDALQNAREYIRRHSREYLGWNLLSEAWSALGEPDSARMAFERAIELDPAHPKGDELILFARYAYQDGDVERARELTEQYLQREDLTNSARRWWMLVTSVRLGLVAYHVEAGRYEDAIRAVEEAKQFSDGNLSGWAFGKGGVLLLVGRVEEALQLAEAINDQYSDVRTPFYGLRLRARAFTALNDLEGAREAVTELYAAQERWGSMARLLALKVEAEIALAEKNSLAALGALDEMREFGIPLGGLFDIQCREARARAYHMAGRLEDAVAEHKELLRIYAGHALSHFALGGIYEELGQNSDAELAYSRFLQMWANADEGLPELSIAPERLRILRKGS